MLIWVMVITVPSLVREVTQTTPALGILMTVITYRHLEVLIVLLSCCTAELVGVVFLLSYVNLKPVQCSGESRPLKDIPSV